MAQRTLAVGIDVGGTNARLALVDSKGRIVRKLSSSSKKIQSAPQFLDWTEKSIKTLIKDEPKAFRLKGIGVGVPGSVDTSKGQIHFLPNLPKWKRVDLGRLMTKRFKTKVVIDNDANAMAQGEAIFGAAKNATTSVFLTLGTGVGGGLVINNKLYRGKTFSAAEIGHLRFGGSNTKCNCGSRGCIETELGNGYLLKKIKKQLKGKKTGGILRLAKNKLSAVSLELVTKAASKGDKTAVKFWDEVGKTLGNFLAGICNLLNPDMIVLGGGVMGAGNFILSPLKKELKSNSFPMAGKHVTVVTAKFKNDAGLVGAAAMAWAKKK